MGRNVRLTVAGALLLCLASCTGGASPAPQTAPPSRGASPASLTPEQLGDIEQKFARDIIGEGHQPDGEPILTYHQGEAVDLIWHTTDQNLCFLTDTVGQVYYCSPLRRPPADAPPGLKVLWGPGDTGYDFMTVFLADREEVHTMTCGGVRTELKRVGEFGGTDLAVYTYVTPWSPDGTLQADVVRDGHPGVEQVSLAGLGSTDQRDWLRTCGFRPIAHP